MSLDEVNVDALPENSCIALDLDSTVIETKSHIGSEEWEMHLYRSYLSQGFSDAAALRLACKAWGILQHKVDVKAVEEHAPDTIYRWREKHDVIGLTARCHELKEATHRQLCSVGIDFSFGDVEKNVHEMPRADFYRGVLYCGDCDKGTAFRRFLETSELRYPHIAFVDDKASNLSILETIFAPHFTGYHFTGCEHKKALFNISTADIELLKLCNEDVAFSEEIKELFSSR